MVQINPNLLKEEAPKSNGASKQSTARNGSLSWLVLMKNAFSSALEKTTVRVRVNNEKQLQQGLAQVTKLLENIITAQKNVDIGRTDTMTTGAVGDFRINNLESLTVENIEGLTTAFKELNPILKSLELSQQSSRQTIGLLNKLITQVNAVAKAVKESKPEIHVPDRQRVSGSVEVTRMPDAQNRIVEALTKVEAQLKTIATKKTEKKVELAEGRVISDKLDEMTDALKKLPGNMEFPTSVQVTNFPPQKIPQPVTNISINALAGTVKSRNITVTTSATPLPDEVLSSRRSLVIYNNSSQTVYVGGSDVSTTNGMPVPASSYSPAFDAGEKMVIYGIVASTTANIRTLEASDIRTGR